MIYALIFSNAHISRFMQRDAFGTVSNLVELFDPINPM